MDIMYISFLWGLRTCTNICILSSLQSMFTSIYTLDNYFLKSCEIGIAHYHAHAQCTNEENEAGRGEMTCPVSPSSYVAEPRSKFWLSTARFDCILHLHIVAWVSCVWCWPWIILEVTFSVSKVSTWMPLGYLKKRKKTWHQ